jgi:hypothetical protein
MRLQMLANSCQYFCSEFKSRNPRHDPFEQEGSVISPTNGSDRHDEMIITPRNYAEMLFSPIRFGGFSAAAATLKMRFRLQYMHLTQTC